jgi:hypothetical protein
LIASVHPYQCCKRRKKRGKRRKTVGKKITRSSADYR